MIFTLDERLHLAEHVEPGRPPQDHASLVGGQHTRPALIEHDGAQSGVKLRLGPLAARALFGLPAGELADPDAPGRRPPSPVEHAWRLLLASGGRIPVGAVADRVGWSRRHLARRFEVEVGLPPKVAARVIRFDRARRMLTRLDGAHVAARCGCADQSHLVRDSTASTGTTPTRWLAAEVSNVRAPTTAGRGR